MNLNFFTRDALHILKKDIEENLDWYKEPERWIIKYFETKGINRYCFFSEKIVDEIKLKGIEAESDAENAITIHKVLREKLSRVNAMDERLWAYLAHVEFYDYMYGRWLSNKEIKPSVIKERFFYSGGKKNRRNGIARLYWGADLTYSEELSDPYEYTKYLFAKQDRYQTVTDSEFARNKNVLLSALKVLKTEEEKGTGLSEAEGRRYFTYLNQAGGIYVLDSLQKKEAQKLSENIFQRIIKERF